MLLPNNPGQLYVVFATLSSRHSIVMVGNPKALVDTLKKTI